MSCVWSEGVGVGCGVGAVNAPCTSSSLEIDEETLEDHRETISSGARALRQDAFVKAYALL